MWYGMVMWGNMYVYIWISEYPLEGYRLYNESWDIQSITGSAVDLWHGSQTVVNTQGLFVLVYLLQKEQR